ncbi:hypothetical protein LUZ60_010551 [Juncus effusus]|nr:hypothetical protein LUZ60_010551 [Juncus effusus]
MDQGSDFLRWGNRRKLHRGKSGEDSSPVKSDCLRRTRPRANRRIFGDKGSHAPLPSDSPFHLRNTDSISNENHKSPDKDRYYSTRGSTVGFEETGTGTGTTNGGLDEKGPFVLPRFFISLSNKEKEEDFMAMKGCKLPQRPKKRSKLIQKCLLTVSPGAWLSDLSHERYEVREKKSSRKRIRGLKAMCMESDSE